jgi:hypothetical protein
MAYVNINENYRISIEEECLVLQKYDGIKTKTKKGVEVEEEFWKSEKYYTTWEGVFNKLIRIFTLEDIGNQTIDFAELKDVIIRCTDRVEKLLKGYM